MLVGVPQLHVPAEEPHTLHEVMIFAEHCAVVPPFNPEQVHV